MSPPTTVSVATAAAKHLSRAIIAAATPSRSWTSSLEQNLHRFLPSSSPLTPSLIAATIDPHLLPHHPLASGLFHWATHQPGFSHTPASFHALLKSLSLSPHPNSILSLLHFARARRIPLLPASYHLAASSLLLSNNTLEAARLIEESAVSDFPPALYNSLLAAAASSDGLTGLARKVFDVMLKRDVPFNNVGFGVFIGRFSRSVDLDVTLGLVEEVTRRVCTLNGSVIAFLIVDGLCRVGRGEDAWRSLEELRLRGCKPDFIPYRLVSEAFRLAGRGEDSRRILKQKRKMGVAPRANDYGEFIVSLISERRIHEAKEMGEAIVSGDFPIEDDVLNALIGSVSAVDPDSAGLFCKYMIGKERFPSLAVLNSLSRSLCKNEKSDEMWEIFRALIDKGYFSGVEQYNLMVSFLCKAGRLREAYDVLKEMKKNGLHPDISSYNTLMEACCRQGLLRPAKKLWDEMFANGCDPDLQTYNVLVQKFAEEGEAEEAYRLFNHMLNKGVLPDNSTYRSLIKVMCQEKMLEAALDIFKRSLEQDVAIAGSTLSTLIQSLCNEGNTVAASGVLHGLPSSVDNVESHVILLKCLTDAGEVEMAIKHIEWVRSNSPSWLHIILTELIASLSTAPNLERILQFLQALHAQGLVSKDSPWMKLLEC